MTTFTLTSDERKVAESGSVDFSKFTDPTKGWDNVDYLSETRKLDGISFTAQDVLDNGFTVEQASSLLNLSSRTYWYGSCKTAIWRIWVNRGFAS